MQRFQYFLHLTNQNTILNLYHMKKNLILLSLLCFFAISSTANLYSQEKHRRNLFDLRLGYGNMLQGTAGLTNMQSSYINTLSSGFAWDAAYYFRFPKQPSKMNVGLGLQYNGFTSSGELQYSSDQLFINNVALQFALIYQFNNKMELRGNIGGGMIYYLNKSAVYGKDRRVTGSSGATNLGVNFTYMLTPLLGLSLDCGYLFAGLDEIESEYHGEKIKVTFNDDLLSLSRLNITAGITFRF